MKPLIVKCSLVSLYFLPLNMPYYFTYTSHGAGLMRIVIQLNRNILLINKLILKGGVQIPGTRSPERLNFYDGA
jgi:hypothetical protein